MRSNTRLAIALLFLALIPSARAQNKLLTIDDIFDPGKRVNFSGTPANPRWLNDGLHYLVVSKDRSAFPRLLKVNAVSGATTPFYDAAKMQAAFAALPGISKEDAHRLANQSSYQLNPNETGALITFANDLFYYEFGSDRAVRLTSGPEEEVGEGFSPDGRMVSFIRGGNLYVEDLSMQRRERALTRDGNDKILNGRLDWVYQEELYGRGNFSAYWWSPDSTKIVFLRLDEHPVPEFPVVDHVPLDQRLEETPYPKAGDPNPIVKLGVVGAAGGDIHWVDTFKYAPEDLLIVRVGWFPDSKKVWYMAQNREQTFIDLNSANPDDGKSSNLFRESTKPGSASTMMACAGLRMDHFSGSAIGTGGPTSITTAPTGNLSSRSRMATGTCSPSAKWMMRGAQSISAPASIVISPTTCMRLRSMVPVSRALTSAKEIIAPSLTRALLTS